MKVNIKNLKSKNAKMPEKVYIRGEYIKLDALLKFAGLAGTGGEAKLMIQDGNVKVNGETCTQRCRKIIPGAIVRLGGSSVMVLKGGEQDLGG